VSLLLQGEQIFSLLKRTKSCEHARALQHKSTFLTTHALGCLRMAWAGLFILNVCCSAGKLRHNVLYKIKENVVTLPRRHHHCRLALSWVQCRPPLGAEAPSLGVNISSLQSVSMSELQPAIAVCNPARAWHRRMNVMSHMMYLLVLYDISYDITIFCL
jgi:hypothetical protein